MIALAIALAAALLQIPATASPAKTSMTPEAPMTIDKGDQSNVDDGKQVVVRTEAEWTKLWQQHTPDRKRPAVDLSRDMVIGVFMGSRPTAGFSVDIVSTIQANGALTVRYRETQPPKGAITAQVLTSPYHLVAAPKFAGDVTFEKVP